MKISNVLVKTATAMAVASMMTACGGGSSAVTPPAGAPIGGGGFKGPYQQGSTVTVCKFADAVATKTCPAGSITTTTTDNAGSFVLPATTWVGPSLVTVSGNYQNELTDGPGIFSQNGMIKSVVVLGGTAPVTANPNIVTTVAAEMLLTQAAANPGMVVDAASAGSAGAMAMSALGLPPGDPNALTLSDPAMLTVSAAMASVLAAGGDPASLASSFATDINAGQPLGSTPVAGVAGLGAALTAAVAAASNPANYATPPAVAPAVVADPTVLTGLALVGNQLTIGAQAAATCTVSVNQTPAGVANCAGVANQNDAVFNMPLVNYGVTTGTPIAMTVTFDVADSAITVGTTKRRITGSISPVNLTITAQNTFSVTVPANAVLTFSGTTSLGAPVSGSVTNLAANTISANAGVVSFNANTLLNTVQAKAGNVANELVNFTIPGNYAFSFGLSVPVGIQAGNALGQLIPAGALGGRVISGSVTVQ